MKKIVFTKGNWEQEMIYSVSYRFDAKTAPTFIQEEDCVVNAANPSMPNGYDYINLFLEEPYGIGTKLSMETSFEDFGAPNISLATKLDIDADGYVRHGEYYEVVLHEEGLSFWKLYLVDGVQKWYKILAVNFPVACNEIHTLNVETVLGKHADKFLKVDVNGEHNVYLRICDMPDKFYVGISACEQINRIYSFTVEEPDA